MRASADKKKGHKRKKSSKRRGRHERKGTGRSQRPGHGHGRSRSRRSTRGHRRNLVTMDQSIPVAVTRAVFNDEFGELDWDFFRASKATWLAMDQFVEEASVLKISAPEMLRAMEEADTTKELERRRRKNQERKRVKERQKQVKRAQKSEAWYRSSQKQATSGSSDEKSGAESDESLYESALSDEDFQALAEGISDSDDDDAFTHGSEDESAATGGEAVTDTDAEEMTTAAEGVSTIFADETSVVSGSTSKHKRKQSTKEVRLQKLDDEADAEDELTSKRKKWVISRRQKMEKMRSAAKTAESKWFDENLHSWMLENDARKLQQFDGDLEALWAAQCNMFTHDFLDSEYRNGKRLSYTLLESGKGLEGVNYVESLFDGFWDLYGYDSIDFESRFATVQTLLAFVREKYESLDKYKSAKKKNPKKVMKRIPSVCKVIIDHNGFCYLYGSMRPHCDWQKEFLLNTPRENRLLHVTLRNWMDGVMFYNMGMKTVHFPIRTPAQASLLRFRKHSRHIRAEVYISSFIATADAVIVMIAERHSSALTGFWDRDVALVCGAADGSMIPSIVRFHELNTAVVVLPPCTLHEFSSGSSMLPATSKSKKKHYSAQLPVAGCLLLCDLIQKVWRSYLAPLAQDRPIFWLAHGRSCAELFTAFRKEPFAVGSKNISQPAGVVLMDWLPYDPEKELAPYYPPREEMPCMASVLSCGKLPLPLEADATALSTLASEGVLNQSMADWHLDVADSSVDVKASFVNASTDPWDAPVYVTCSEPWNRRMTPARKREEIQAYIIKRIELWRHKRLVELGRKEGEFPYLQPVLEAVEYIEEEQLSDFEDEAFEREELEAKRKRHEMRQKQRREKMKQKRALPSVDTDLELKQLSALVHTKRGLRPNWALFRKYPAIFSSKLMKELEGDADSHRRVMRLVFSKDGDSFVPPEWMQKSSRKAAATGRFTALSTTSSTSSTLSSSSYLSETEESSDEVKTIEEDSDYDSSAIDLTDARLEDSDESDDGLSGGKPHLERKATDELKMSVPTPVRHKASAFAQAAGSRSPVADMRSDTASADDSYSVEGSTEPVEVDTFSDALSKAPTVKDVTTLDVLEYTYEKSTFGKTPPTKKKKKKKKHRGKATVSLTESELESKLDQPDSGRRAFLTPKAGGRKQMEERSGDKTRGSVGDEKENETIEMRKIEMEDASNDSESGSAESDVDSAIVGDTPVPRAAVEKRQSTIDEIQTHIKTSTQKFSDAKSFDAEAMLASVLSVESMFTTPRSVASPATDTGTVGSRVSASSRPIGVGRDKARESENEKEESESEEESESGLSAYAASDFSDTSSEEQSEEQDTGSTAAISAALDGLGTASGSGKKGVETEVDLVAKSGKTDSGSVSERRVATEKKASKDSLGGLSDITVSSSEVDTAAFGIGLDGVGAEKDTDLKEPSDIVTDSDSDDFEDDSGDDGKQQPVAATQKQSSVSSALLSPMKASPSVGGSEGVSAMSASSAFSSAAIEMSTDDFEQMMQQMRNPATAIRISEKLSTASRSSSRIGSPLLGSDPGISTLPMFETAAKPKPKKAKAVSTAKKGKRKGRKKGKKKRKDSGTVSPDDTSVFGFVD